MSEKTEPEWLARVRQEEAELSARLGKLINYLGRFDPESSEPLVPGVDLDHQSLGLLHIQCSAMSLYRKVLVQRIMRGTSKDELATPTETPYREPQTLEELRDEPGFNPDNWNWCVDRNSVPDGTGGFTDRVEVYVMGTGSEQCLHAITMPEGITLDDAEAKVKQMFGERRVLRGLG